LKNKKSGKGILTVYNKKAFELVQRYEGKFLTGLKHEVGY